MDTQQGSHTPLRPILKQKPSSSGSSIASAASATSAGTQRSGGSRLLFGEIDTTSERSADSYASVCSLVLSDSSTFLRFWLLDECRDRLFSLLPTTDLASLRLVCHDFSTRAAPALFSDLRITFKPNTFTKPSKQAALQRCGFHVKHLTFNIPHNKEAFLPPLIDPETGDELNYTYTPRIQSVAIRQPRYGDWETTEILTRQYPPIFHAATNVHAFIQAFSAFVNLTHLTVSCPGWNASTRYRRSAVDYALISLRIAVERNCLNALDKLTLSPIHPGGLTYLSPMLGYGATPSSPRRWTRIKHLTLHIDTFPNLHQNMEHNQTRLLHTYLNAFRKNLQSLSFRWNNNKGPLPFQELKHNIQHPSTVQERPSTSPTSSKKTHSQQDTLIFPQLNRLEIENAASSAMSISAVIALHKRTLEDLDLKEIDLTEGTWEQAFAPLTRMAAKSVATETAEIPIMLSPTTGVLFPRPMDRIEVEQQATGTRRSLRTSRWLGGKKLSQLTPRTPLLTSKKVKYSLQECENQVRRVFKGSVFQWM